MIEFKNVSKTFSTKTGPVTAIEDVNLAIPNGQIFGIIGYSGAGKTTLIRMLNGLEKPTTGEVKINDVVINQLTGAALAQQRHKIGIVFSIYRETMRPPTPPLKREELRYSCEKPTTISTTDSMINSRIVMHFILIIFCSFMTHPLLP